MTSIAVMQPYFIPYAGYFRLFTETDLVCVFDCVQFPRRGLVHRNRLPGVVGQEQWLTLPIAKTSMSVRISDLTFSENASKKLADRCRAFPILRSANYPLYDAMLNPAGDTVNYLINLLSIACKEMNIPFNVVRTSALKIPTAFTGQDRVLEVCRKFGANKYVNLSGGRKLYDRELFGRHGIELKLLEPWLGSSWSILYRLLKEPASSVAAEIKSQP